MRHREVQEPKVKGLLIGRTRSHAPESLFLTMKLESRVMPLVVISPGMASWLLLWDF